MLTKYDFICLAFKTHREISWDFCWDGETPTHPKTTHLIYARFPFVGHVCLIIIEPASAELPANDCFNNEKSSVEDLSQNCDNTTKHWFFSTQSSSKMQFVTVLYCQGSTLKKQTYKTQRTVCTVSWLVILEGLIYFDLCKNVHLHWNEKGHINALMTGRFRHILIHPEDMTEFFSEHGYIR